ncbi:hypothetical protein FK85_00255 [Halorubrum saccharovorum]|uniref:Uncharacterized protein n=1 Tax=Halorubrum saccharovorum TaxID=2248 RepID=A0A081EW10_9EURY|nr:hypothetical protein [Halorubrum saccharovorum]KDS91598.1 hypothetical protein FK85_00255 [Halorubrum saccharovorum]
MSTAGDPIRYATADEVLLALDADTDPATVPEHTRNRAIKRAASATNKWINRTGRAFHPVRVGAVDEPRSWEVHDVQDAMSWSPATVTLDNARPMPLDPAEGDTIEIRSGRSQWDDVTDEEGDAWAMDYRRRRLRVFERRRAISRRDDPNTSFVRLTYRYGPLGEDVQINADNVVESAPPDVREAVAAKAASMLALSDNTALDIPDNGQLASRTSRSEALESAYEDTAAEYSGFSSL